ncbi:MAG TPA: alpha/beta family hydrolase [Steroidobacteraceae bacterium]|nr:alpha/beta family hydrolase [Steroidobacteraceae bacterium]
MSGVSLPSAQPATIAVDAKRRVSALLMLPQKPSACFVFAHGAGAGMQHPFMAAMASALVERDIATVRFQFPYMEAGSRRPDVPAVCHATVRAAVEEASQQCPGVPLIAGGRSFGGRMTSQAQAQQPLPAVRGLAFLGFPLHPAGRPSEERAQHLQEVDLPLLFLQGTRDELAELSLLQGVVGRLAPRATLKWMEDADHSFHVPARSGRKDAQVVQDLAQTLTDWLPIVLSA